MKLIMFLLAAFVLSGCGEGGNVPQYKVGDKVYIDSVYEISGKGEVGEITAIYTKGYPGVVYDIKVYKPMQKGYVVIPKVSEDYLRQFIPDPT